MMLMQRQLIDRVHDRVWREAGQWLACQPDIPEAAGSDMQSSSISAGMPWADICAAFADGKIEHRNFRRTSAVRDIVETVGPVDGRFYARRIHAWGSEWLTHETITRLDTWGDPIRWPGFLLGTHRAFSPTTLRYLATALWLKRSGYLQAGAEIVEIGVGFGGLAAMNALVSGAITTLVDLPQVEHTALRMLHETGLGGHGRLSLERDQASIPLVISNYAFTELSAASQESYFDRYLKSATHGLIISNAAHFASTIRGRSDDMLVAWLREAGLPAKLEYRNDLLGPGDHLCGVSMIHW